MGAIWLCALVVLACWAAPGKAVDAPGREETPCAKSCHTINCDNMGIRYGRYCGVGHGGCAGVEPCDPVDLCCKRHDTCVEKSSVFDNRCHKRFLKCLGKHVNKDDEGFAPQTCPYSLVIPTMKAGIEMVMGFAGGGGEL
ncbi:Phospholipase A2-beta [Tetrabaena socialis]|uniref:Phospholipase A2-beta n=1 Tax=Tetrabaena socialis TaxID=47790 RepID=A0A2J8ADU7_9CHLO|nr:Phospholipase A2-beta [Tetrabaena socialis]|eukprot:PNH10697.1 Phospholipase A2-beta [Tetrabaena socialis]